MLRESFLDALLQASTVGHFDQLCDVFFGGLCGGFCVLLDLEFDVELVVLCLGLSFLVLFFVLKFPDLFFQFVSVLLVVRLLAC